MNKILTLYKHLIARTWILGIADYSEDIINTDYELNIRWVKNDEFADRWFADPFIISEDENIIKVLAEEFSYKIGKGRIARLLIDKTQMRIVDVKIVLELETHLSFPCYFRENGNIYIYPENSASGNLYLYKYDEEKDIVHLDKLMISKPLTDAVLCVVNNMQYLFSTQCPRENKEQLDIYRISINSQINIEEYQSVYFDENIARSAGKLFVAKGKLIRPAQISNNGYGEGVILQEVTLNEKGFSFKEIKRYFSPLKRYPLAFHTFNVNSDRIIFDAQGYRYRYIGFTLEYIGRFIKLFVRYNR